MAKGNVWVHKMLVSPFTDSLVTNPTNFRDWRADNETRVRNGFVKANGIGNRVDDWPFRTVFVGRETFRSVAGPYGGAFSTDACVPSRFDRVHCRCRQPLTGLRLDLRRSRRRLFSRVHNTPSPFGSRLVILRYGSVGRVATVGSEDNGSTREYP